MSFNRYMEIEQVPVTTGCPAVPPTVTFFGERLLDGSMRAALQATAFNAHGPADRVVEVRVFAPRTGRYHTSPTWAGDVSANRHQILHAFQECVKEGLVVQIGRFTFEKVNF